MNNIKVGDIVEYANLYGIVVRIDKNLAIVEWFQYPIHTINRQYYYASDLTKVSS
jgi:hypothetical protein